VNGVRRFAEHIDEGVIPGLVVADAARETSKRGGGAVEALEQGPEADAGARSPVIAAVTPRA